MNSFNNDDPDFDYDSFDHEMYELIYDPYQTPPNTKDEMPGVKSICYEYSDNVEITSTGKSNAYRVVIKSKYFSDMFSRMKSKGYACLSAEDMGDGLHLVTFGKAGEDFIE